MNNCRRVVFRGDDFNKHAIDKVPASDQRVKAMAAVLHARLQDLADAERKKHLANSESNPVKSQAQTGHDILDCKLRAPS